MKGIVMAGGSGSRLYPSTKSISKQLLPIYDKPTLFYPLAVFMLAGIRQILIISTARDLPMISELLGDGSKLGVEFSYKIQEQPNGIAEAFLIGESFIDNSACSLILGDNFFYGDMVPQRLQAAIQESKGATIFAYHVQDPENYGVVSFDDAGKAVAIDEKPKVPKSNWAVTGLYHFDKQAVGWVKGLKPSARGELEITDLNQKYLEAQQLKVVQFGRGIAWLDTGTPDAMLSASAFVQTIEHRQGLKIACLEEIALNRGFISKSQFKALAEELPNSSYGSYLKDLAAE